MNLQLNKKQKVATFACLIFGAVFLNACGSTTNEGLVGVGGLGDDVTATVPDQTDLPVTEVPTETPNPTPSGHIVFTSDRDGAMNLYMASPDGSEQTRLTVSNSIDTDPRLSPDGTRVAFVSTVNNNMDVYVLDIASLNITRVTDAPEKDSAPAWSPDGNRLTFESFRDGNFEIYVANADGSNTVRLTNDPAGDSNPVWSPVSDEITFVSNRFGNADILILTLNGSVSTLTTNVAPDSAPAWSPDGNMIAFKTHSDKLANVCVIGRDGLNQRCLTNAPSEYSAPIWSPTGASLAVSAKQSAGYGVDIFNIADGTVTQLYSAGVEPLGPPTWSFDGLWIAFQAETGGNMELYVATVATNEFSRITSMPAFDGDPIWTPQ
jgi:Tol biopolymer transport system component